MDKINLIQLYKERKLSMMEIADEFNITHAKVTYWFKRYNISRRKREESSYLKHNPQGDPFKVKVDSQKDRELLLIGLMLYWAEGNKSNKYAVRLGNLDGRIIKLFVKFLRKVCQLNEDKITLYVQLYKNFDKEKALLYWKKLLDLKKEQILIYPHTDIRSKHHKQWSKNGIATVQVNNIKLKCWMDQSIDRYASKWCKG